MQSAALRLNFICIVPVDGKRLLENDAVEGRSDGGGLEVRHGEMLTAWSVLASPPHPNHHRQGGCSLSWVYYLAMKTLGVTTATSQVLLCDESVGVPVPTSRMVSRVPVCL
jgi:hypothetical protein